MLYEPRLLELILQQSDPLAPVSEVLTPIAHLFRTEPQRGQGDMVRVVDKTDAAIAIATPLPGERERPCELITPPIEENHLEQIESLLSIARSLGFTAPKEGATHIHLSPSDTYLPFLELQRCWHAYQALRFQSWSNIKNSPVEC